MIDLQISSNGPPSPYLSRTGGSIRLVSSAITNYSQSQEPRRRSRSAIKEITFSSTRSFFSLSLGSINNSYKLFIRPLLDLFFLISIQSFLLPSIFSNYSSDLKLDFRLLRKQTTFVWNVLPFFSQASSRISSPIARGSFTRCLRRLTVPSTSRMRTCSRTYSRNWRIITPRER